MPTLRGVPHSDLLSALREVPESSRASAADILASLRAAGRDREAAALADLPAAAVEAAARGRLPQDLRE